MQKLILGIFVGFLVLSWQGTAWQATSTATASFSAIVPSTLSLSLAKQTNSACTNPEQVVFDKLDSNDVASGDPGYMYAPYRSLSGKNWHVAKMTANSSGTLTLKVDATLTGISKDKLKVWFGGFYNSGSSTAIPGTTSSDWEAIGSTKSVTGPFVGECPLSYQLYVADVAAGTYSGTITITLTQ